MAIHKIIITCKVKALRVYRNVMIDHTRCCVCSSDAVLLKDSSFSSQSQLKAITKNSPDTLLTLRSCVLEPACQACTAADVSVDDVTLLKFIKCFQCLGLSEALTHTCSVSDEQYSHDTHVHYRVHTNIVGTCML